jgi:hypothetical protein
MLTYDRAQLLPGEKLIQGGLTFLGAKKLAEEHQAAADELNIAVGDCLFPHKPVFAVTRMRG